MRVKVDLGTSTEPYERVGHLLRVTGVSRWTRVLVGLRSACPLLVTLPAAAISGRLAWRSSSQGRERALRWATATLGEDAPAKDVARLARRGLRDDAIKNELILHPRAARRMPVEGLERLQALQESGRG